MNPEIDLTPEVIIAVDKKLSEVNKEVFKIRFKKLIPCMVIVSYFIILSFVGNESKSPSHYKADLNAIKDSNYKVFNLIEYKGGLNGNDYTYCESEKDVYDIITDFPNNRLVIVCKVSSESYRYFKYSTLDSNKKVTFCGWRDFIDKYNPVKGVWETNFNDSSKNVDMQNRKDYGCNNFDITKFNHGLKIDV